ncbi:hypothetical protein J6590_010051 [Homalodisca vitripennis]|nr:hypothetical protein J6590_010051 [Homalodisca vitripennis]
MGKEGGTRAHPHRAIGIGDTSFWVSRTVRKGRVQDASNIVRYSRGTPPPYITLGGRPPIATATILMGSVRFARHLQRHLITQPTCLADRYSRIQMFPPPAGKPISSHFRLLHPTSNTECLHSLSPSRSVVFI